MKMTEEARVTLAQITTAIAEIWAVDDGQLETLAGAARALIYECPGTPDERAATMLRSIVAIARERAERDDALAERDDVLDDLQDMGVLD